MHITDTDKVGLLLQRHLALHIGNDRFRKRVFASLVIGFVFWQVFQKATSYFDDTMLALVAASMLALPLVSMLRCLIEFCQPRHR